MSPKKKVEESLSGLEKFFKKIPGYKGYKEKELRRESDKLLRMQVAAAFDEQRKRLQELQVQLISEAQIEFLDDVERAVMKLQILIDRIRTAAYGYAGLFDAVKVKEKELDALYEFDNKLLDFEEQIAAQVDKVTSAISTKEGVGVAVAELVLAVEQASLTFWHRQDVVLQDAEESLEP
jgi:hypothetical protein